MTNKELNKILKPLESFDPKAKPDWETFVADNGAQLENFDKTIEIEATNASKQITGFKYATILLGIVASVFFVWYYSGNVSDEKIDNPTTIQSIEAPVLPSTPLGTESIPVSQVDTNDEIANEIIDTDPQKISGENNDEVIPTQDDESVTFPTEIVKPVVVKSSDTVFIKKTILIKDTIRVKKTLLK